MALKACIQRVSSASVEVSGEKVATIGKGLLVLVGIGNGATKEDSAYIARKLLSLRLWPTEDGKPWSRSVQDNNYQVLLVSQFTLHVVLKGNKPDFHNSMPPEKARAFYDDFVEEVKRSYKPSPSPSPAALDSSPSSSLSALVQQGVFGAMMNVHLVNDGPVTLTIESPSTSSSTSSPSPAGLSKRQQKKQQPRPPKPSEPTPSPSDVST